MATYEEALKAYRQGKSAHLILTACRREVSFLVRLRLMNDVVDFMILKQGEKCPDGWTEDETKYASYLKSDNTNRATLDYYIPDDWKERTDWVIE